MEQAPNVFPLEVADTTITFGWNIPGDTPNAIRIQRDSPNPTVFGEFTANDAGFFWTSFQDIGLQPGIIYEYSVCCEYATQTLCGTVTQRTTGQTPPPPPITMQITGVQAYPRRLELIGGTWIDQSNALKISWAASGPIDQLSVEVDSTSGSPVKAENFAGAGFPASSGTVYPFAVPTPGATYLVKVRGSTTTWTNFSPSVQITTLSNFHSLRGFLGASGVSGSKGIKGFITVRPLSLRWLLGV